MLTFVLFFPDMLIVTFCHIRSHLDELYYLYKVPSSY